MKEYKGETIHWLSGFDIKWSNGILIGLEICPLDTKVTSGTIIKLHFIFFEVSYSWLAMFKTKEDKTRITKNLNQPKP